MATETDDQTLAGAIDDLARRGFTVLPRRLLAKRLYAAERREPEGAATTSDGLLPRLEQLLQSVGGLRQCPLDLAPWGKGYARPNGLFIGEVAARSGLSRKALRLVRPAWPRLRTWGRWDAC